MQTATEATLALLATAASDFDRAVSAPANARARIDSRIKLGVNAALCALRTDRGGPQRIEHAEVGAACDEALASIGCTSLRAMRLSSAKAAAACRALAATL